MRKKTEEQDFIHAAVDVMYIGEEKRKLEKLLLDQIAMFEQQSNKRISHIELYRGKDNLLVDIRIRIER